MTTFNKLVLETPERLFAFIAVAVTLLRLLFLPFSQINLGPDETQYWWWAQEPAFGYFSKPPMIAWLIGSTTSLFGDAEWAVRLSSPLLTLATSWIIFLTAQKLYDAQTGLWAGLIWLTLPIISISGFIISTDVPMLFFWSLALYAFVSLTKRSSTGLALLLGIALGLGMLSKYAMIYFPLGMGLAALLSPLARQALRPKTLLCAAGVALVVFLPNIFWNAANDFQTLDHTRANASWNGNLLNIEELAEFLGAQFAVIGPLLFGALLWGLYRTFKNPAAPSSDQARDKLLVAFILPPLVIICIQAFISRANANWAMAAYPAAIILVTSLLLRINKSLFLKASLSLHSALLAVATLASVNLSIIDTLGLSDGVKRLRDWETQAADIATYAENYSAIVVDDRELMGNLLYYLRDLKKPIYAWDINRRIEYHYEAFDRYPVGRAEPTLLVTKYPEYLYTYVEFPNILELGKSTLDTKVACPRQYSLYELSGYDASKGIADIPRPAKPVTRRNGSCKPY